MTRLAYVAGTTGFVLLFAAHATGACRTTTCDRVDPPANCPVKTDMCACTTAAVAIKIKWPDTCVSTSVNSQGSVKRSITADDMRAIVHGAFQKWTTSAQCQSGGSPSFVVDTFPDVNCTDVTGDDAGYKSGGPNYNVWIFRDGDDEWPYDSVGENAIAITTTQFSRDTGEIYDSDVELNSRDNDFATPDTMGPSRMDLASVVQHESGHFLGLAHSCVADAVMQPTLDLGVVRRDLSSDDISGICEAYPPNHLNPTCNPEPRHGFSTECAFQPSSCSVSHVPQQRSKGVLTIVFALGLALLRRRRYVSWHGDW